MTRKRLQLFNSTVYTGNINTTQSGKNALHLSVNVFSPKVY